MVTGDPHSSTPKQGLSGLAVAGIGCGALLLIAIVAGAIIGMQMMKKIKEVAGPDWQKNPAKTAALFVAKANPDWEIVKTDDNAGTIVVRDKKSGEEFTMSFDDVAKGKFRIKNAKGEETTVDASTIGGGKIVIKGPDGETIIGDTAATAPPAWVPAYPGAQAQLGGMRTQKDGVAAGTFIAQTQDAESKVREFWEANLKAGGYKIETASAELNAPTTVHATNERTKRTLTVIVSAQNGMTRILINYQGPD